jgi:hypothetical protein
MENKESPNTIKPPEKMPFRFTNANTFEELDNISSVGDSENVEMGSCLKLKRDDYITARSYNANPCVCGILQTNDNEIYMFHSVADFLTDKQNEILKNSYRGVVGGGKKTLEQLFQEFDGSNIKVIPSPGDNYGFNITYVKERNQFDVKPGLYYCYDDINQFNED